MAAFPVANIKSDGPTDRGADGKYEGDVEGEDNDGMKV